MKTLKSDFVLAALVLLSGCATTQWPADVTDIGTKPNVSVTEKAETPVPEIPLYEPPAKVYDVSSRLCVYDTLWVSKPLAGALTGAGYTVLPNSHGPGAWTVDSPDFIVEPLSFKHFTERRSSGIWLYTRLVVQVRSPLEAVFGETDVGLRSAPRIFQVYARRKLDPGVEAGEAQYRKNVDLAASNLMCVAEFREALSRSSLAGAKPRPLADFLPANYGYGMRGGTVPMPEVHAGRKPSFKLPARGIPAAWPGREALVGEWRCDYKTETISTVNDREYVRQMDCVAILDLQPDGAARMRNKVHNTETVHDGTWTCEKDRLVLDLKDAAGKSRPTAMKVFWYGNSEMELQHADVQSYAQSLMVGQVKQVAVEYDPAGCMKTYMVIGDNAVPIFMIASPNIYKRGHAGSN